jgi:hypothetical protein
VVATLLAAAMTACGGSGGTKEEPELNVQGVNVAASDVERLVRAEESVQTFCGRIRDQAGSDMPIRQAVRIFVDAHRRNPEGIYAPANADRQRSMEAVVEQNAARLERCGATPEAQRLRDALE